jgi:hypothetical protein
MAQGQEGSARGVTLFPSGTVPDDRFKILSALCSYGHNQNLITGMLRQILMQHFVDPEQVLIDSLRRYLETNGAWKEGVTSGLYVEALHRWRPELTEARPTILVKEGKWRWERLGIGNLLSADWVTGREEFSGLWSGTHTLFAVAKQGAETLSLAAEVAKVLLWYGREITLSFDLQFFTVVSIGELAALKESTEHYVVPVDVAYLVPESWFLEQEAPRLKRIVFRASDFIGYGG